MKLSAKALALTAGILWGASILITGLINLAFPNYGSEFLETMASVYPCFHASRTFFDVIVGTLYGFLDGLVGGFIFAWLYNRFTPAGS